MNSTGRRKVKRVRIRQHVVELVACRLKGHSVSNGECMECKVNIYWMSGRGDIVIPYGVKASPPMVLMGVAS